MQKPLCVLAGAAILALSATTGEMKWRYGSRVSGPGNGAQGFLSNNGNGSSTLFAPGLPPQTVFTPR